MKDLNTITQTGAANSGLNLGGFGTGGVELWPDGRFYQWNCVNALPWAAYEQKPWNHVMPAIQPRPMDADFFIRIQQPGKRPVYRWLFTGHGLSCGTASHFWRHHKYFFIRTLEAIRYRAEFPFIHLDYVDSELPVKCSLKAWTSFVPRNVKDSSLPGFFLDFSFENTGKQPLEVSLVWQQQNLCGHDREKSVQEHAVLRQGRTTIIEMRGDLNAPEHDTSGSMAVWAEGQKGQTITALSGNPYMQNIIWSIHRTGGLDGALIPERLQREEMNNPVNLEVPNKAWLCVQQKLAAGEKTTMHLGLGWFFPHHRSTKGTYVGHMYANWFGGAAEVASYHVKNRAKLEAGSQRLPALVLESTLPEPLKLALLDQLSTLTKCSHYIKDGRFGIQEGLGCCCFNTVDVDHYGSYTLSLLYPELREVCMEMLRAMHHPVNGKVYHGFPGTIEPVKAGGTAEDGYNRWDCCVQYITQVYRDAKWSGNRAMLERHWPHMVKAMNLVASMDFYGVALPYIEGGITYDHWRMKGVVNYMAGLYLTALLAMEDVAELLDDDAYAALSRERFEHGLMSYEKLLWNGKQYVLYYGRREKGWKPDHEDRGHEGHLDPQRPPAELCGVYQPESCCGGDCDCEGDCDGREGCCQESACGDDDAAGCCGGAGKSQAKGSGCCEREPVYMELQDTGMMTDLLNGNATAAVIGLGSYLDPERVRRQLKLILERNTQPENACVVNGTYPDEHFLDEWPFMQWQTPWTGTEYFLAIKLYAAGLVKEGDKVIDLVHRRHVREGMRWDHGECNNHYVRPLCIWGAWAARIGYDADFIRGHLALRLNKGVGAYKGALVTGVGLGRADLAVGTGQTRLALEWLDGRAELRSLTLATAKLTKKLVVKLDGKVLAAEIDATKTEATVAFAKKLVLKPGSVLEVVLKP